MRLTKAEREAAIGNAERMLYRNAPTGYRFGVMVRKIGETRRATVLQASNSGHIIDVSLYVSSIAELPITRGGQLIIRGHGYSALDDIKARLESALGVPVTVDTL